MRRASWVLVVAAACGGGKATPDAMVGDDEPADGSIDGSPGDASVQLSPPPIGLCPTDWCWVYPWPQGRALHTVWASSETNIWASGENNTLIQFDGTDWTSHDVGMEVWGIFGTSASNVWVSGYGGIKHWDGTTWTTPDSTSVGIKPLGGTGTNDVWASCDRHWDGTSWSGVALPAAGWQPIAIGGVTSSTWCVSNQGGIAKWLGTTWGVADAGSRASNAAAVVGDGKVVLAGDGVVWFWDGTTFTQNTPPVTANWTEAAGSSLADVTVTGHNFGSPRDIYRYHWNGTSWTRTNDTMTDSGWAQALSTDSSGKVYAAMMDAEVRVWNGTSWVAKTSGDNFVQLGYGTDNDDFWTVSVVPYPTFHHRIQHWDGSTLSDIPFSYDLTYRLTRMWGTGANDYWISAGHRISNGLWERILFRWTGSAWSVVGPFGTETETSGNGFEAVWGASSTDVYAVARAALYHYDGTSWTQVTAVPGGSDVFGSGANDVYVVNGTELWKWDGTVWSSKTIPGTMTRGWSNSASDVWLSGTSGSYHFDGTFFVTLPGVGGIPFGKSTEMYVLTSAGLTKWPTGFGGSSATFGTAPLLPYGGVWQLPSGNIYIAGNGIAVHEP